MPSICALWAWRASSWRIGSTYWLISAERRRSNGSWSATTSTIRPPWTFTSTWTVPYGVSSVGPITSAVVDVCDGAGVARAVGLTVGWAVGTGSDDGDRPSRSGARVGADAAPCRGVEAVIDASVDGASAPVRPVGEAAATWAGRSPRPCDSRRLGLEVEQEDQAQGRSGQRELPLGPGSSCPPAAGVAPSEPSASVREAGFPGHAGGDGATTRR